MGKPFPRSNLENLSGIEDRALLELNRITTCDPGVLAPRPGKVGHAPHLESAHRSPPSTQTCALAPPDSRSARACQLPTGYTLQGTSWFSHLL